jgi:hypothetical protein
VRTDDSDVLAGDAIKHYHSVVVCVCHEYLLIVIHAYAYRVIQAAWGVTLLAVSDLTDIGK